MGTGGKGNRGDAVIASFLFYCERLLILVLEVINIRVSDFNFKEKVFHFYIFLIM